MTLLERLLPGRPSALPCAKPAPPQPRGVDKPALRIAARRARPSGPRGRYGGSLHSYQCRLPLYSLPFYPRALRSAPPLAPPPSGCRCCTGCTRAATPPRPPRSRQRLSRCAVSNKVANGGGNGVVARVRVTLGPRGPRGPLGARVTVTPRYPDNAGFIAENAGQSGGGAVPGRASASGPAAAFNAARINKVVKSYELWRGKKSQRRGPPAAGRARAFTFTGAGGNSDVVCTHWRCGGDNAAAPGEGL